MCSAESSRFPEEREDGIVQQPVSQFDHTSASYVELLDSLKLRIQQARTKAALSVNRELVLSTGTLVTESSKSKPSRVGGQLLLNAFRETCRLPCLMLEGFR